MSGLALYMGGSLVGGLAASPEVLLVARAVQGLGLTQALRWEAVNLGWGSPGIVASATAWREGDAAYERG